MECTALEFYESLNDETLHGPEGDASIDLVGLLLENSSRLVSLGKTTHGIDRNDVTFKEDYERNGTFETRTSLGGFITGNRKDKTTYSGKAIKFSDTVLMEMCEVAAKNIEYEVFFMIRTEWVNQYWESKRR